MTVSIFALGMFMPCFSPGATADTAPEVTADLRPKAYRTWRIELPADAFRPVSGSIPIPHAGGDGFAVENRGVGLAVDLDGDGTLDRVIEGREHPETKIREARFVLQSKHADGTDLRYPVRLESKGAGWAWAPGGALVGEIAGAQVAIIDLDGNGHHGDVGTDAMTVGGSDVAQFMGETISIDGKLHSVEIEGTSISASPYSGDVGHLDLRSELDAKGVLLGAVVKSLDGKHSFEMSGAEKGMEVPTGRYRLIHASVGLGDARVTVDARRMRAMSVKSGAETRLAWGAPVKASFDIDYKGGDIVLDPSKVRYVGAGGERWIGWDPVGKSPEFSIKEKTTGDVLVDVVFPGSC